MENTSRKFTVHLHCPSCKADLTSIANAVDTDTETLVCPSCDFHYDNISEDILKAFTKPMLTYITIVAFKALPVNSKAEIATMICKHAGVEDVHVSQLMILLEKHNCGITTGDRGDDFTMQFRVEKSDIVGFLAAIAERSEVLRDLFRPYDEFTFERTENETLSGLVTDVRWHGIEWNDQKKIVNILRKRLANLGISVPSEKLHELLKQDPTIVPSDEDSYFNTRSRELNSIINSIAGIYHQQHPQIDVAYDKNEDAITPGMQAPKEELTFFQEIERNAAIVATGVWGNDTVALWTSPKDIMFRFEDGKGFLQMNKTLAALPTSHKWALFSRSHACNYQSVTVLAWDGTDLRIGFVAHEAFDWNELPEPVINELDIMQNFGLVVPPTILRSLLQSLKSRTLWI